MLLLLLVLACSGCESEIVGLPIICGLLAAGYMQHRCEATAIFHDGDVLYRALDVSRRHAVRTI